jgi:hypothetical protein
VQITAKAAPSQIRTARVTQRFQTPGIRLHLKRSGETISTIARAHQIIIGGIGHNLRQETPRAFVEAFVGADDF